MNTPMQIGDRVKGYGPEVPFSTMGCPMGTITCVDEINEKPYAVKWDGNGEIRRHGGDELKRI